MNATSPHSGGSRKLSGDRLHERSSRTRRPKTTPLQVWLDSLFALLLDARDELDDAAYTAYIYIATERLALEAGRLLVHEAIREKRRAA